MILEPKTLAARRSLVDLSEVSILFDLANDPSANVRFNALDTLTHLPLPKQGWVQVVTRIRQELQKASSFDDKAALLQLGTWVPHIFDAEDEVRKIEAGSKVQEELLAAVRAFDAIAQSEKIMIASGQPCKHQGSFCSRNQSC